jgi:alpha-mannosidase
MKVIAYLHTHWDREWYRTFEEFRFRFFEVFDDIVNKLEKEEFSQFYLDGQTILIDDWLEITPEKKPLLQKLIKEKKLIVGPWYTLADEFLASGECLIRNLLIGTKQAKAYGVEDFVGYLPDAFGHTQGMVDILNSFGIKNAILWRGAADKKSEFIWQSKSEAQVTVTHLLEGYFQDFFNANMIDNVAKLLDKIKENNVGDLILLPIGADHLGACNDLPTKIKEFNEKCQDQIEVASVFDYLNQPKSNIDTYQNEIRDNLKNFILQGTYSTRNYLKRANTLTSWELKKIETLATLIGKENILPSTKDFVDYAWKLLLQNHAHDSICGCSVDSVHDEMETRLDKINQLLGTIKSKAIENFDGKELEALNTSGFEYTGTFELQTTKKLKAKDGFELIKKDFTFPQKILQNIHQIPVSEDLANIYTYLVQAESLPALNFARITPSIDSDLMITQNSIGNSKIGLKIEADGKIAITDKVHNKEYSDFIEFEDRADVGDTYNYSPILGDKPIKATFIKSKVIKEGKLRNILELEHHLQIPKKSKPDSRSKETTLHKIKTQVILDAKSPILKFKTEFDNKAKDHILQVKFTMSELVSTTASEDSIGIIERTFDPHYDLQKQKTAQEGKELPVNTAPMQRFVWAQNTGILTKGIHEYEVFENNLSITLLRAVGMLSGKKLHTRYNAAGPTIPTPGAQCLGLNICEYAISFTEKQEKMMKLADYYFEPVVAFFSDNVQDTGISINNPNIAVLACKEAENKSGIVLRLLNLSEHNQQTKIQGIPVTSEEIPLSDKVESIELKPYELKSVLIAQS